MDEYKNLPCPICEESVQWIEDKFQFLCKGCNKFFDHPEDNLCRNEGHYSYWAPYFREGKREF